MTEENKPKLFSAYRVLPEKKEGISDNLHAYLIESTASTNIEIADTSDDSKYKGKLIHLKADGDGGVIDEIASALCNSKNPNLLISVHGFNNPRDVILPGFWKSFECVNNDKYISNQDIVCIGYRWPSEKILSPLNTIFEASPISLVWLFKAGIIFLFVLSITLASAWYENSRGILDHNATMLIGTADTLVAILATLIFLAIPVTLFLLRIAVYFRDGYRATSFGVPDLVEIIRQIDKKLVERRSRFWSFWAGAPPNRVQLSFIAHSMGGYVVTSVVRILSDVFDLASVREGLNSTQLSGDVRGPKELSKIGHAFCLKRLVLVSPDIPAEALISNRANFLSSSLSRFEEAFLFSNEGDEVLRQISTTANYFSFPTKSSSFGYRLGNVCLLGLQYGINIEKFSQSYLQIGMMTLSEINKSIEKDTGRKDLARLFTYFDCTDCVDIDTRNGKTRGMLTLAKPGVFKKMRSYDHFWLLLRYLRFRCPDVHGGYFDSKFLRLLIYRLVCIGYKDTVKAYAAEGDTLDKQCKDHQVRVLLKS